MKVTQSGASTRFWQGLNWGVFVITRDSGAPRSRCSDTPSASRRAAPSEYLERLPIFVIYLRGNCLRPTATLFEQSTQFCFKRRSGKGWACHCQPPLRDGILLALFSPFFWSPGSSSAQRGHLESTDLQAGTTQGDERSL